MNIHKGKFCNETPQLESITGGGSVWFLWNHNEKLHHIYWKDPFIAIACALYFKVCLHWRHGVSSWFGGPHKLCSFVLCSLECQAVWLHSWHLHIPGLDVCNHIVAKFTSSYAIIIRSYISILRGSYSQGCLNIEKNKSSSYSNKSIRLKDVSLFTITSITWFTTLFNP